MLDYLFSCHSKLVPRQTGDVAAAYLCITFGVRLTFDKRLLQCLTCILSFVLNLCVVVFRFLIRSMFFIFITVILIKNTIKINLILMTSMLSQRKLKDWS